MKNVPTLFLLLLLIPACRQTKNPYDASGTFEAIETIIPANAAGIIEKLNVSEGEVIDSGIVVGYIDSTQLFLRKKQLQAQVKAVLSKKPNIDKQLASYQEQLKQAEHEQQRLSKLVKADAATPKQLDDANAQVQIIKKQIEGVQSTLGITSSGISEEANPYYTQIEQINDQLMKCRIINPIRGTVLTKYAEQYEMASIGKALYKIAPLTDLILRAYLTGDQLPGLKLGQQLTVLVDDSGGKYKEYSGTIEWISDKAEFTPKTIQTKDERANLIYAVKIKVQNDGFLKIGMYGEIKF
jgi:HlyD family secretion protein